MSLFLFVKWLSKEMVFLRRFYLITVALCAYAHLSDKSIVEETDMNALFIK